MSNLITPVFIFKIGLFFNEWVATFDSEEADRRHSGYDVKPLFRGVRKEEPQKVIIIHLAPEGNMRKFIEANGDWMITHEVDISTMKESAWI